jgi:hypothetical protein
VTDRSSDPADEGVNRTQRRSPCRELIIGEIRVRWDGAKQRESSTLGDEPGIVIGCANHDQAGRTWNISDQRERAKHGLELRSARARDDTETIGARKKPTIQAVGPSAQIENDWRLAGDRLDDVDRSIDVQAPT